VQVGRESQFPADLLAPWREGYLEGNRTILVLAVLAVLMVLLVWLLSQVGVI
jgi:hypothetical protein